MISAYRTYRYRVVRILGIDTANKQLTNNKHKAHLNAACIILNTNLQMCGTYHNLLAMPLSLLDNSEHEPQRCYLPPQQAPSNRLNAWYKCTLNDGSYAVCYISARAGNETCCFLDNIVSSSSAFAAANKTLTRLEPLTVVANTPKVDCVLHITPQLLQRAHLSLSQLRLSVCAFLRHLVLVNNCFVQHKRLLALGITAIEISEVDGLADNQCFQWTRATELHIVDIRLSANSNALPSASSYHPYGFERAMQQLEQLLHSSQLEQSAGLPLNALIVGAVGSGKSTLLAEFVRRHSCNCFHISATQVLRSYPGETEAELRRIFAAAHAYSARLQPQLPIVMLLEDLQLLCPAMPADAKHASNALRVAAQLYTLIDELPRRASRIICLATSSSPDSLHAYARRAGRFAHEISIDMPTAEQRQQLFAAFFKQRFPQQQLSDALLEHVALHTQGYVVADLSLLMRKLEHAMLLHPAEPAAMEALLRQALQQCQPSASRATDVSVTQMSVGFESIGGMEALKRTLQVSVLAGLQQSAAFARFGLSLPKGVLLYGPPGCAKTTIAKCLAKEAHMTFIATSAAEVYSPYVGCAERFITRIFDAARKNAPCLIFLDEIDSLVGRRTVSHNAGSGDVQLRILSTLLTEMDGIVGGGQQQHILVVAATNRPDMIDDALLRPGRFDKLIHVPAPDLKSRLALLQLQAQRMPFAACVNLAEIATLTERYSGADLCNLCNEAAMQSFQRSFAASSIEMQDFLLVLSKQKSSLTQNQIEAYYKFAHRFV